MYFLGVDGGGTKTCFTLVGQEGRLKGRVVKGTCHPTQIGYQNLKNLLTDGLKEICKSANILEKDITNSYLGLAGYGIVKEIREGIEKTVAEVFKDKNYTLNNDVRVAIAGALSGNEGINIVAGTGSIVLGLKDNEIKRCGGWGYSVGDEGSAYWIGKKAIALFSKESDGREEKSFLYEVMKKELKLEDDYKIISFVNDKIKGDRSEIAKISRICSLAANLGDKKAKEVFEEAGKELASAAKVLLRDYNTKVSISYAGGVFKSGELILNPLKEALKDYDCEVIEPEFEPDLGACLLAMEGYIKLNSEIKNNLKEII